MIPIKVLLAEDHTIVRKGLLFLLAEQLDIEIVGEAANGQEAVAKALALQPDVVVMDITMPLLNGLEATRHIKRALPDTKVVILTVHTTEEYIFQILQAGASGYVVKQAAPDELLMAIKAACRGDTFLSPSISQTVIQEYIQHVTAIRKEDDLSLLTDRERQVLQLLAEGHTNREVAQLLVISVKTVETHRANLMHKLDLHNIADLTRYAIRRGVIGIEP